MDYKSELAYTVVVSEEFIKEFDNIKIRIESYARIKYNSLGSLINTVIITDKIKQEYLHCYKDLSKILHFNISKYIDKYPIIPKLLESTLQSIDKRINDLNAYRNTLNTFGFRRRVDFEGKFMIQQNEKEDDEKTFDYIWSSYLNRKRVLVEDLMYNNINLKKINNRGNKKPNKNFFGKYSYK